jgi:hypothetical protein
MPKKWQLKEDSDAKDFNGKKNRGSGNKWYSPGDVRSETFLIESKQTDKKSYSLNKAKLNKIYEEALFSYKIPLMSIKIQDLDIIVIFKEDFDKLLQQKNQSV